MLFYPDINYVGVRILRTVERPHPHKSAFVLTSPGHPHCVLSRSLFGGFGGWDCHFILVHAGGLCAALMVAFACIVLSVVFGCFAFIVESGILV